MSSTEPALFPCPECGTSRGVRGAPCKKCGWDPNMVPAPTKPKFEPYSKSKALVVGFLTVLPFLYVFFFLTVMILSLVGGRDPGGGFFALIVVMHFAVIFLGWGLLFFYIYFLFNTEQVKQDQKVLWAVILFFGNMMVMPIFWYLYIWKPAEKNAI